MFDRSKIVLLCLSIMINLVSFAICDAQIFPSGQGLFLLKTQDYWQMYETPSKESLLKSLRSKMIGSRKNFAPLMNIKLLKKIQHIRCGHSIFLNAAIDEIGVGRVVIVDFLLIEKTSNNKHYYRLIETWYTPEAVSYTHLTLPTILLV